MPPSGSFMSAWATIINAVRGSWGELNADVIEDTEVEFSVTRGRFYGELDTELEGVQTITLPFSVLGVAFIQVLDVLGNEVTAEKTYILENTQTIDITLNTGRKILIFSGTIGRL